MVVHNRYSQRKTIHGRRVDIRRTRHGIAIRNDLAMLLVRFMLVSQNPKTPVCIIK